MECHNFIEILHLPTDFYGSEPVTEPRARAGEGFLP